MHNFLMLITVLGFLSCNGTTTSKSKDNIVEVADEKNPNQIASELLRQNNSSLQEKLEGVGIGNVAPLGTFLTEDSITMTTDAFKGKLLILDFWATWCSPCISSMPKFKDMESKYESEQVEFTTISINEEFDEWKEHLDDYSWVTDNYWLGLPDDEPFLDFALNKIEVGGKESIQIALPSYVIISPDGVILNDESAGPDAPAFEEEIQGYIKKYGL